MSALLSHPVTPSLTPAVEIACNIKNGTLHVQDFIEHVLESLSSRKLEKTFGAVTSILTETAQQQAAKIAADLAHGRDPGPLAGVPFGVKDLFDIAGKTTTAGSRLLANNPPAVEHAHCVQLLVKAGAIPVATLNMDEFAYGFITENTHYGTTRNPHNIHHYAGGSSGGSAAVVAAGLLPFSLGSDTNGSIRVPAALCGIWGLRPTFGHLSLKGVYPFAKSLDTIGPLCNSLSDLYTLYQIMSDTHPSKLKDLSQTLSTEDIRVSQLGGWFTEDVHPFLLQRIEDMSSLFKGPSSIELPYTDEIRAAAFLITAAEGGTLHHDTLKTHADMYDPALRERLAAGCLQPSSTYLMAQNIRTWFRHTFANLFAKADVLIAPTCSDIAPRLDTPFVTLRGKAMPARAHLGRYTQPLSLGGMPILAAPLHIPTGQNTPPLPLGIQLIAQPHKENHLFAVADQLQKIGFLHSFQKI
ncbi:AtzE family amidohydrolase [Entomobacter blattae]|uniref:Biuret hydrolase n=1 Tax=Entomobacter blattae TaxID=2762277 RepID=A0A7H1NU76_9PROT|nr:AtzE family amidohydrolase [Entomobacter blattae]QNT79336.1 Biuret hydrolase [Entomobacter blattae]